MQREWNHSERVLFAEKFHQTIRPAELQHGPVRRIFLSAGFSGPALDVKTVSYFFNSAWYWSQTKITSCIWIWNLYLSRRTIQIEVWPVRTSVFLHFYLSRVVGQSLRSSPALEATNYNQTSNISHTQSKNLNVPCLFLQLSLPKSSKPGLFSREWRCNWSSADRRCSNYIWVINNFTAYKCAAYIRGLTVYFYV